MQCGWHKIRDRDAVAGTDTSVDLNNTEAVGDAVLAGDTEAPPGDAPEPEVPKSALEKELEKIKTSSPDFNQWVTLEKMTEAEVWFS